MKTGLKFALLWLALLSAAFCYANEESENHKYLVDKAIERFKTSKKSQWAYTHQSYEDEEGEVTEFTATFDPTQSGLNRWQLIELNGEIPSPKQLQKFQNKRFNKDDSYEVSLDDLIDSSQLTVVDETSDMLRLSFPVTIERLGDGAVGKLQGELELNKKKEFIQRLKVYNTDEFSAMALATIQELKIEFTFIELSGWVLPQSNSMQMKGKMTWFIKINEVSKDLFKDYQYIGDTSDTGPIANR